MGSTVEYVESSQIYATHYIRNSKAISVLWAIFTICYAIIAIVAFVTPEWIGDMESEYPGKFGLWSSCQTDETGEKCTGRLDEFFESPGSPIFQIATVLVGISVIAAFLTICAMLLFFFCPSTTVFHICGWLQLLSAITIATGALIYPLGWNTPAVHRTCGPTSANFAPGLCSVRWAYALAVIGALDAIVLASLAFVLATRHVKLQADDLVYGRSGSVYKGEINNAYITDAVSVAESRKSLNLHPVLLVQQGPPPPAGPVNHNSTMNHHHQLNLNHHQTNQTMDDSYSQFSSRNTLSVNRAAGYQNAIHNFQL